MKRGPIAELALLHGMTKHRTTSWLRWGLIDHPAASGPLCPVTKKPGESIEEFLDRYVRDYPPLHSRQDAARFREILVHLWKVPTVDMPDSRLEQARDILAGEGVTAPACQQYFELVGGSRRSISRFARIDRTGREPGCPSDLAAQGALSVYPDQFHAIRELGLLDELRPGSDAHGEPLDLATLHTTVVARFASLTAGTMTIERIRHYNQARRGLRMETYEPHPPAFLEGVVDMLVSLRQTVSVDAVKFLIAGDLDQTRAYLVHRARTRQDVPMPKRNVPHGATLRDLQEDAPEELKHAWRTALDPVRGSSMMAASASDIAGIREIAHEQIHPISIVVSLHGREQAHLAGRCAQAVRALRNLAPRLSRVNVTDPVELRAAFSAIRMLEATGDRYDKRNTDEDLRCWRFAVEIFDDYRDEVGMPADLARYLDGIAPVLPAGSHAFYADVLDDLEEFSRVSKNERITRLEPILVDLPAFCRTVFHERARFVGYRRSVLRTLKRARRGARDETAIAARGVHVEILPDPAGGPPIVQEYAFVVRHWRTITDELRRLKPHKEKYNRVDKALPREGWEAGLLENRFVVEHLGCRQVAGAAPAAPMPWIAMFENRVYWQPLGVDTHEDYLKRAAWLADNGFMEDMLRNHGRGVGTFEGGKGAIARRANRLLGMTLLPLEEVNHSQLIGLVNISTRLDNALRTGEISQFNIGSGLETGYDAQGKPFTILSAIRKNRTDPHDFVLSDVSEALVDELLGVASRRFHQGRGVGVSARATELRKGPAEEAHVFTHGKRSLRGYQINLHSRILIAGCYDLRGHDLKYVWTRLEKLNGMSDEDIQDGHGHRIALTTKGYDVTLPSEREEFLRLRIDAARERRAWLDGETPVPVQLTGRRALEREHRRIEAMIDFHRGEGEADEASRLELRLRAVIAKIGKLSDDKH